jgi:hypothetical protein
MRQTSKRVPDGAEKDGPGYNSGYRTRPPRDHCGAKLRWFAMGHSPQPIPVQEHDDYGLLWSLADATAKQEATTDEACWLEIMDAFWGGKIQALYCFSARKSGPGRELNKLPARDVIAGYFLGNKEPPNYAALRGWTLEDYLEHDPFSSYATRDARFGLAIPRGDFERWRTTSRSAPIAVPSRSDRFSQKSVTNFVQTYIANEKTAGRHPTQVGLVKAVREAGIKGGRDLLRRVFNKFMHMAGEGVKPGPPKKNV